MNSIFGTIALLPPILFAIVNLIDKKVVHDESVEKQLSSFAYMAMGGLIELLIIIPLGITCMFSCGFPSLEVFIPLFLNGLLATASVWLYLQALKIEEASKVIPWFQFIPAFGLLIAWLCMSEVISGLGILGIFLLMFGGFTMWISKGKINWKMVGLMLASSLFCAGNDVILANYGRGLFSGMTYRSANLGGEIVQALPMIFVDLLGKVLFGILLLVSRKIRSEVYLGMKSKLGLTVTSTLVFDLGDATFDIAKLFAPVAIVQALCCTQPLFVLLGAVILSIFFRGFLKEEMSRTTLLQKFVSISLMVAGGILLTKLLG